MSAPMSRAAQSVEWTENMSEEDYYAAVSRAWARAEEEYLND